MKEDLQLGIGIIGIAFTAFLFFAPVLTFRRIVSDQTTGQYSVVPYITTLLNCLFSTWYALPFVSPETNTSMLTTNIVGIVVEGMYVCLFLKYTQSVLERGKIRAMLSVAISFFILIVLVSIVLDGSSREYLFRITTTVSSIITYGSPMTIMHQVIETRSVEFMPLLLSIAMFLHGSLWILYGQLGKELSVILSNALGFVLGLGQLVLYSIYWGQVPTEAHNPAQGEVEDEAPPGNVEN